MRVVPLVLMEFVVSYTTVYKQSPVPDMDPNNNWIYDRFMMEDLASGFVPDDTDKAVYSHRRAWLDPDDGQRSLFFRVTPPPSAGDPTLPLW